MAREAIEPAVTDLLSAELGRSEAASRTPAGAGCGAGGT